MIEFARVCLFALALGAGSACAPGVERIDDPYTGDAPYPDRRPQFQLPSGEVGFVSNNGSDSVNLLDLERGSVIGSAPVGRDPVDLDGPHHIAVDRAAGLAFVALAYPAPAVAPGPHAAHGSSERAGYAQVLALADFAPISEVRLEPNPGDIVLSDDGQRLVVSHFDLARALRETTLDAQRADLAVMSAQAPAALSPMFIRVCVAPHGVALSRPSGDVAFVACYGEDALAVVDLADPSTPIQYVSLGPGGMPGSPVYGPYAAVLSPDGQWLAVSNTESNEVRVLDTATRSFLPVHISTPGAAYFAAWSADSSTLYVPVQNPDALVVADARSGKVAFTKPTAPDCQRPHEATFGAATNELYVVCEGDHLHPSVVLSLAPDTLTVSKRFDVGVYPDRLAIARGSQ